MKKETTNSELFDLAFEKDKLRFKMQLRLQRLYEQSLWYGYVEVARQKRVKGKRVNKRYTEYSLRKIAQRIGVELKYVCPA